MKGSHLHRAGAVARQMLLAAAAAALAVPGSSEVSLKNAAGFRLIGTARGQIDEPLMVTEGGIRQALLQKLGERAKASPGGEGVTLEAIYEVPFLAHATMEPMNCTADVRPDQCTVWAPAQDPRKPESGRGASPSCPTRL